MKLKLGAGNATNTGLSGNVGHRRNMSAAMSEQNMNKNRSKQRILQIKGQMGSKEGKPRFNENVEEEARSIRDDISITASQRLSKSLLKNRVRGVGFNQGSSCAGASSVNHYSIR